jgi:hypothetical protein
MWARAVLAAFIGVWVYLPQTIAIGSVEPGMRLELYQKVISHGQAHAIYLKTKFGSMTRCASENIIVFDPAPQVPFGISGNWFQFGCADTNERCMHFPLWADQSMSKQSGVRKLKTRRDVFGEFLTADVDDDVSCGRLFFRIAANP